MTLAVTDDISSATTDENDKRRGVAGDLAVFKVAAAAAEAGCRSTRCTASPRSRTTAPARSASPSPDARCPAPASRCSPCRQGRMAVGIGIHGEPGIGETDIPTADGLAELLVDDAARRAARRRRRGDGARVVPILNGLGTVKYEELFVVYRRIAQLLTDAGVTIVDPRSASSSRASTWPECRSPCSGWTTNSKSSGTPRRTPRPTARATPPHADVAAADAVEPPLGSSPSTRSPSPTTRRARPRARVVDVLTAIRDTIDANVDRARRHRRGRRRRRPRHRHAARSARRASSAASAARDRGAGAGAVLNAGADAWSDRAGGTSGALWGVSLRAVGAAIGDDGKPDAQDVAAGVAAACAASSRSARPRSATRRWSTCSAPASAALTQAVADGHDLGCGVRVRQRPSPTTPRAATARLLPRMGRARPHAEKSLGTPDPGAVSMALAFAPSSRTGRKVLRPCPPMTT